MRACPFCGGAAQRVEPEPQAYGIECTRCHAASALVYALKDAVQDLVTESWNTRTPHDAQRVQQAAQGVLAARLSYHSGGDPGMIFDADDAEVESQRRGYWAVDARAIDALEQALGVDESDAPA